MICVSFSIHLISTYYVRKGSWAFYLNYPQINEVEKSDFPDSPLPFWAAATTTPFGHILVAGEGGRVP